MEGYGTKSNLPGQRRDTAGRGGPLLAAAFISWYGRFMNRVVAMAVLIGAFWTSACVEEMDPISLVNKFRVMAVQADPPEIRPGEGITHRVLFSDPKGDGREIQIVWFTCRGRMTSSEDILASGGGAVDPSTMTAADGCDLLGADFGTASGEVAEYRVPAVPADVLDDLPEGETVAYATTVVILCAGGRFPVGLQTPGNIDGNAELCEGGDGIMALKTFRISEQDDDGRNTNPDIAEMRFKDKPLAEISGDVGDASTVGRFRCKNTEACLKGVKIYATLTKESYQSYEEEVLGEVEVVDDDPYISWFVTGGNLGADRSRPAASDMKFQVTWHPPLDGGRFALYVVAHDLRGGTSWKKYAIEAVTAE